MGEVGTHKMKVQKMMKNGDYLKGFVWDDQTFLGAKQPYNHFVFCHPEVFKAVYLYEKGLLLHTI